MNPNTEWMSRLYHTRNLKNRALKEIVLPGSHDAGTSDINLCSPLETTNRSWWAPLAKIVKFVTVNYSKTQKLVPYEQAMLGIRYFDLRVYAQKKDATTRYRYTHGLLSSDFINSFKNLCDFAQQHPREILILDIRFTKNFTADDHDYLQTIIASTAGRRLAHASHFDPNTKLRKYCDNSKNIIVVYPRHRRNEMYGFWDPQRVHPFWARTTDPGECIEKMDTAISSRDLTTTQIYNLNACLTPDDQYIRRHPFSSTRKLAKKINKALAEEITKDEWQGKLNCVSVDFVGKPGLIEAIINLN